MSAPVALIAIGGSAGGVQAVRYLLKELGKDLPCAVAVTLHLPRDSRVDVAMIFNQGPAVEVVEDKTPLRPGHVYFAPPDYHMLFERDQTISLTQDEPVCYSRPSIDVMFESAARAFGKGVTGVLLTGANEDGARGLAAIHQAGGKTIVQDPESAEIRAMPDAALALFTPVHVCDLERIPALIGEICGAAHE